jgi:hypothetical protein
VTATRKRHPLLGAWAKYGQAAQHSERYQDLFNEFIASNPFSVLGAAQEDKYSASLGPADVWHELSCAAGDSIHNLRSALDHVAYAVGSQRLTEEQLGHLSFTIRSTPEAFAEALRKEPASLMGADWKAFLLSVQPFQGAPYSDLGRISELDNIDKHRLIFSLTPRSDVHSRRSDGDWDEESVDLRDGLVRLPTDDTAFVIASHFLSLPKVGSTSGKPRPVERDFLDFYCVVGHVIRAVQAQFFPADRE